MVRHQPQLQLQQLPWVAQVGTQHGLDLFQAIDVRVPMDVHMPGCIGNAAVVLKVSLQGWDKLRAMFPIVGQ